MIAVREFSTGAECIAHAAANRRKFFPKTKARNIFVKEPVQEKADLGKAEIVLPENKRSQKKENCIFKVKSHWELSNADFNAHVIAYRLFILRKEMIMSGYDDPDEASYRKPIIEIVMDVLKSHPGITVSDIKGKTRSKPVVAARHRAMYEVYCQRQDLSYPRVGSWFGGKDHTSAIFAVRKIAKQLGVKLPERS